MGRIKDFLMEAQEMKEEGIDWITVKQNEIVKVHSGKTSLIYNDLFEMEELLEKDKVCNITTINGQYNVPTNNIIYISGNCIRYTTTIYRDDTIIGKSISSIPIDKITHMSIRQLYDNEVE